MISKDKVKAFWDARAASYDQVDFDSIGNLESDPESLALKTRLETDMVFQYLGSVEGKSVLDLGAGVGQWAFRFVDRGARHITAVEFSAALADVGRREAERRGADNVTFAVSPAEHFKSDSTFDVVYISGLFVYLNDDQADLLLSNLRGFCRPDTKVLLRDGTGVFGRHEIDDKPSTALNAKYSATYRTAEEYERIFAEHGLALKRHENMFYDGCPLNKFPETRLRIYLFGVTNA